LFIFSENKNTLVQRERHSSIFDLDINIIKKIKSGDIASYKTIVEKYKDKALNLLMKILKNIEDSEDALQDAFIKTYKAILEDQFEERASFSTYFYRIVYNTALDHYKRKKSKEFNNISFDEYLSAGDEDIDSFQISLEKRFISDYTKDVYKTDIALANSEIQRIVNDSISLMPEKYSLLLTMFYINDLSYDEIASILKLPLGTVKNRLFRAKDKIKEIILNRFNEKDIQLYL
jgi:RNA polymerase sigma-70 factor, ECF subfamily